MFIQMGRYMSSIFTTLIFVINWLARLTTISQIKGSMPGHMELCPCVLKINLYKNILHARNFCSSSLCIDARWASNFLHCSFAWSKVTPSRFWSNSPLFVILALKWQKNIIQQKILTKKHDWLKYFQPLSQAKWFN